MGVDSGGNSPLSGGGAASLFGAGGSAGGVGASMFDATGSGASLFGGTPSHSVRMDYDLLGLSNRLFLRTYISF